MLFSVIVVVFCAAWPIEGQIENTNEKSATKELRWSWNSSMYTSQVSMPPVTIFNTENNQNGTKDETPTKEFLVAQLVAYLHDIEREVLKIVENNDTDVKVTIADLCSKFDTPVPDFTAPGRRISEIKCKELIWKIKYVTAKERVSEDCKDLKNINNTDLLSLIKPVVGGGRVAKPGEFPHMGAIGWKGNNGKWQFKCGSSLISPKFVLTAAHCTKASEGDTTLADPVPKIIRFSRELLIFGILDKKNPNVDIDILNIMSHPDYNSPKKYYDIALMELKRAVEFSEQVQPACLWGYSDLSKLGSTATVSGWGATAEGKIDISPELLAADLDIIDSDKCTEYLKDQCNRNWCGLRDHQLCAGKLAGGVDACEGDSGGPLQVKIPLYIHTPYNLHYIIGVTSFGIGCTRPDLPGVYTRVSSFIDWIENIGAIGWKGINGEWQFKCGSSLISPKFVLTAAHCTKAAEGDTTLADPVPKIVRLSHKIIFMEQLMKRQGKLDINIINIISHPEYNSPKKYYDIALMELIRAVKFSELVQPSCLWGYSDLNKLGSTATLTGWGVLAEGNLKISPELQAAVLDIIDSDKCTEYLKDRCNRNWCGVRDHQLCAGKLTGGVDSCEGDSGGPLQVKIPLDINTTYNLYYIIGVTSFGIGCAQRNLPGVYTRVSSFIDWIESIVWPQ